MRLISIKNAKPGDILGQAILNKDGGIMLRENVVLTELYINRLADLGIYTIYIEDEMLSDIEPQDPKFLEIKSQAVNTLSKIFSKLEYSDKCSELKDTQMIIMDMIEYLLENKEINQTYLVEIKTFDNYTYVHSLNTCVLALFFGVQMSYTKSMLLDLGMGTMLHDIGKTKISKTILNKEEKLTEEEYAVMKKHPELGFRLVENLKFMSDRAKLIVIQHHEKIDGSGYPKGLDGSRISKFAKIACISDIYDAIVSDRVYRKRIPENEAYEYILAGAGNFFDWELVNVFKNNFSLYPLGVCVKLSNGVEGFVVKHNKGFPDRPVLRILTDRAGHPIEPVELDLLQKIDICIDSVII